MSHQPRRKRARWAALQTVRTADSRSTALPAEKRALRDLNDADPIVSTTPSKPTLETRISRRSASSVAALANTTRIPGLLPHTAEGVKRHDPVSLEPGARPRSPAFGGGRARGRRRKPLASTAEAAALIARGPLARRPPLDLTRPSNANTASAGLGPAAENSSMTHQSRLPSNTSPTPTGDNAVDPALLPVSSPSSPPLTALSSGPVQAIHESIPQETQPQAETAPKPNHDEGTSTTLISVTHRGASPPLMTPAQRINGHNSPPDQLTVACPALADTQTPSLRAAKSPFDSNATTCADGSSSCSSQSSTPLPTLDTGLEDAEPRSDAEAQAQPVLSSAVQAIGAASFHTDLPNVKPGMHPTPNHGVKPAPDPMPASLTALTAASQPLLDSLSSPVRPRPRADSQLSTTQILFGESQPLAVSEPAEPPKDLVPEDQTCPTLELAPTEPMQPLDGTPTQALVPLPSTAPHSTLPLPSVPAMGSPTQLLHPATESERSQDGRAHKVAYRDEPNHAPPTTLAQPSLRTISLPESWRCDEEKATFADLSGIGVQC
ncbi:uncharacterized protein MONBRDRAFT_9195 [Monosiga brevicollis MX1]|uniref:Uncharacterized protein n=1 Tax=Monosiga brevicollis TaxID=81824 RepID=A9V2D5_MONBE|nr:uncharacterized protein MONBRDRAFT_9195 [Monosiga brevicollis MX1]EDQ88357.1 predicted protein [Monosiga brevicollis MX1]|eukprot:XP_001746950.1 hypothetical protein [Monosiga brevicollis MX1]